MKALVIGDIHGCLTELQELIKDVDRTQTRIILVGDLIDRGPDSRGVINFVRDNAIECVKGNHEQMATECIPYLKDDDYWPLRDSNWYLNGGESVVDSYDSKDELITDLEWLDNLPTYIETGILDNDELELLVSHTWTSCKDLVLEQDNFAFVWDRAQPGTRKNRSKYYNIYGHTPVDYVNQKKYARMQGPDVIPEPEWFDGACNLDTGCAYPTRGRGYLTGVYFPNLEVIQVKRKD